MTVVDRVIFMYTRIAKKGGYEKIENDSKLIHKIRFGMRQIIGDGVNVGLDIIHRGNGYNFGLFTSAQEGNGFNLGLGLAEKIGNGVNAGFRATQIGKGINIGIDSNKFGSGISLGLLLSSLNEGRGLSLGLINVVEGREVHKGQVLPFMNISTDCMDSDFYKRGRETLYIVEGIGNLEDLANQNLSLKSRLGYSSADDMAIKLARKRLAKEKL